MQKPLLSALISLLSLAASAQEARPFDGHFYNDEYSVYLNIDLHDQDVNVPAHELFGPLPGYLGKQNNSFYWLITAAEVKSDRKAELDIINDYGSEDLRATLERNADGTFTLTQGRGSTLKVPNKGKWQKLPKRLELKKR